MISTFTLSIINVETFYWALKPEYSHLLLSKEIGEKISETGPAWLIDSYVGISRPCGYRDFGIKTVNFTYELWQQ